MKRKWFTGSEVADSLGVSDRWVRRLAQRGIQDGSWIDGVHYMKPRGYKFKRLYNLAKIKEWRFNAYQ